MSSMTEHGARLYKRIGQLWSEARYLATDADVAGAVRNLIVEHDQAVHEHYRLKDQGLSEQLRIVQASTERLVAGYIERVQVLERRIAELEKSA